MNVILNNKKYYLAIVLLLTITDITIYLNLPYIRSIITLLFFSIVPGSLILQILRLNELEFSKKSILAVGLSISFLMFAGLLINEVLFIVGFSKPLSTFPLVTSLSFIFIIFILLAYSTSKNRVHIFDVSNFKQKLKCKLISPLVFPLLFPLLAILGVHLMNTQQNNIILFALLFLILSYFITISFFNNKISDFTYPISIFMIGGALLLVRGLTSNYLLGIDIFYEYYAYQTISHHLFWLCPVIGTEGGLFACLSVSLLPTVYESISGVSGLYLFKVIYPIIGSLVPLSCYIIFKQYLSPLYSFFSSFFLIAQIPFIYSLTSQSRIEVSMLFFSLAIMVIFDESIRKVNKKLLLIIFILSLTVSYYVLPVILLILLFSCLLALKLTNNKTYCDNISSIGISGGLAILLFILIFFWYGQVTNTMFDRYITFINDIFSNFMTMFSNEFRGKDLTYVTDLSGSLAKKLVNLVNIFSFTMVSVGVFGSLLNYKKSSFNIGYLSFLLVSELMIIVLMVLPFVSVGYSGDRLYLQLLVILSPSFIIGVTFVLNILQKYNVMPTSNLKVIVSLLILLFICNTYLIYPLFGYSYSETLHSNSIRRDVYYIYDSDVEGAKWLSSHYSRNVSVYTDGMFSSYGGIFQLVSIEAANNIKKGELGFFARKNNSEDCYIFLRSCTVNHGLIYNRGIYEDGIINIKEVPYLFVQKNKVYSGGVQIYR